MKPDNLKLKTQAKGLARAKLLMRTHLYWFKGFPLYQGNRVVWICPLTKDISSQKIEITAQKLSKASRTINELVKDFPIALPRLVGDVNQWRLRCNNFLSYVKRIINNPDKPFSLFEEDSDYGNKHCKAKVVAKSINAPLVASSWMHYVHRESLNKTISMLCSFQEAGYLSHDLTTVMQLVYLNINYAKKAQGLNQLFNRIGYFKTVTNDQSNYLRPYLKAKFKVTNKIKCKNYKSHSFDKPEKPQPENKSIIMSWLPWLISLNNTQQKSALANIGALKSELALVQWYKWWKKVGTITSTCDNLLLYGDSSRRRELIAQQNKLQSLQKKMPQPIDFDEMASSLKFFIKYKVLSQAITKLLTALPDVSTQNIPNKMLFLPHFRLILDGGDINEKNLANYINHFTLYQIQQKHYPKKHPWIELENYYWGTAESLIFDELKPTDYAGFFEVLSAVQGHVDIKQRGVGFICKVIKAGFERKRCIDVCVYFLKKNMTYDVSEVVLSIACQFNDDNKNISQLARIWAKLDEEYTDDDTLKVIYQTFKNLNETALFRHIVFSGKVKELRQVCYQVRVIEKTKSKQTVPNFVQVTNKNQEWLNFFPCDLYKELQELNNLTTHAQKKAEKIFASHWWTQSMLLKQVELLQKHFDVSDEIQQQRIKPRLLNFQKRLASHTEISEQEINSIKSKLVHIIYFEKFKLWKQRLDGVFNQAWMELFNQTSQGSPSWLFDERLIQQIIPIVDFNARNKKLAQYVIKTRCQKPSCRFIKHPKNQKFIEKLKQNNVNVDCWISGIGSQIYKIKENQVITIDLVTDSLELLNMGGHFKTCLTPGSFNYFSVYANIADVNKQVIYAKDEKGRVIGRVLIAITTSAGLKVFTQYSHHPKYEFQSHVLNYVTQWAKQARLVLTNKGGVEKLISSKWYDDGAVQLDSGIDCFKESSDFRELLPFIKPSEFIQVFESHLAPLHINELTLLSVMRLPELRKNPTLIPVLMDSVHHLKFFSITEKIELYSLSNELKQSKSCYQVFRKGLVKYFITTIKNDNWLDLDCLQIIAKDNPSDALKIIKHYGRKHGKVWQNHLYHGYAQIAVKSFKQLGRDNQAKQIAEKYNLID